MNARLTCALFTLILLSPAAADAASDGDISAIRAEIAALRAEYESRLSALEARLDAAESQATVTGSAAAPPAARPISAAAPVTSRARDSVTAGNAFNPAISLILDGNYYHDPLDGSGSALVGEAFQPSSGGDDHDEEHDGHSGLNNGFNLRAAELAFSATVDPYLDAGAYIVFDDSGGAELEEAWFQTRALPWGLTAKGGRFLSEFGYINRQHPHQWDFADQNLPYLNLLGDHGLLDNGVQLTWLPDLPVYANFGVEVLQGDQERFGAFVADDEERLALGLADRDSGPRLYTTFLKVGPDLGYDHALQLGASYAHSTQHQEAALAAEGESDLWGLDLIYKYDNPSAYGHRDFKLQAEYLRASRDVRVRSGEATGTALELTTDGYYLQGVYGVFPRWQLGLRYDVLGETNRISGIERISFDESDRWTLALTWVPSEFSLFRFQYAYNDILLEPGERERFDAFWLQFLLSLGTHGQHRF